MAFFVLWLNQCGREKGQQLLGLLWFIMDRGAHFQDSPPTPLQPLVLSPSPPTKNQSQSPICAFPLNGSSLQVLTLHVSKTGHHPLFSQAPPAGNTVCSLFPTPQCPVIIHILSPFLGDCFAI